MLNFAAGVEPLPSRIILWSDTYLEHEKANHHDIIKNHPFNYRMEIVLNHSTESIVNYSDALESEIKDEKNNQIIQQLLDTCTKFKENSAIYICSNIQPIDIITFVQDEILNKSDDYLIYCHTLGANSDSMSSNQMAIYPTFNKSENSERIHHLRFRFDKDTLLEMGLQRTEKNKTNSKKTSANSAQFESDTYSTVSYDLPFKNNSKQYERLKWALNREELNPIHCYFGIYSIQNNCWISLDNFEEYMNSNESKIKKISGKEFFNVRVLKEENLLLPQVGISLTEVLSNKSTSSSSSSSTTEPSQSYNAMNENSDEEEDVDEEEDYINTDFFTKVQTVEEEKELVKQQTAKALLNCVGLLSGGMANDFIGSYNKDQQPINDSAEEIISQKNSLLFSNSLTEEVSFSRVDQTFIIKLEGILPPLFIDNIFEKIWKNMTVNDKCYNLMLVTGMEDSVVSWKDFNHTYSISGENDYLYVIFPPRKCTNEQLVTPNWLLQILNQQDELS
ncbi:predicted protein [Naegleria gruberi]|uniref:Predicted protein n=1 Tax=Naegleria gruberi TaxID=5762 RepID=D2UXZ8_NAEGR|nr:uncharacterized protein NAEGRDRAFT_61296 [Naegleria gruberi]EFC50711.1 predicted protein [Naegleria gruberi]|eukprot:XP_002683455.1 predicted protein [Naegleria gruberi strain NEG-M]